MPQSHRGVREAVRGVPLSGLESHQVDLDSGKDALSHCVPCLCLPCRLAGAGGRKKIFRLSDVLKPLTDAQVEAMKLGAVKRILRAEKAVAYSGAAQVRPTPPASPGPSPQEPSSQQRAGPGVRPPRH